MVIGLLRKALDTSITTVLAVDPPLSGPLRNGAAELFGIGSRVRGEAVFHPKGAAFQAVLSVTGRRSWGAPFLDRPGSYDAIVRLSKAFGSPGALPDPLGLAIRVLDAGGPARPLDLVLATTGRSPGLRHVFVPRNNCVATYTSALPYRIGHHRRFIAALPTQPDRLIRAAIDAIGDAVSSEPLAFQIALGTATGDWRTVGSLVLTGPAPEPDDQLCFNVIDHVVDGVRPVGALQRLRGPAYEASQRGRSAQCPMGFG